MSPRAASARSRTRRACARATPRTCSTRSTWTSVRERRFRIVVDYGYSASSFVLPLVVGPMGVEAISAHGFFAEETADRETLAQAVGHTKRLVTAIGADLGAVFDQSGERLYLVDEQGHEVPVDQTLLLYVRLLAERGIHGKAAFPNTVTSKVDELAGDALEIIRTPNSLSDLTSAAPRSRASSSREPWAAATSSRSSCRRTTRWRASPSCSSCSRPSAGRSRSWSQSCPSRR